MRNKGTGRLRQGTDSQYSHSHWQGPKALKDVVAKDRLCKGFEDGSFQPGVEHIN